MISTGCSNQRFMKNFPTTHQRRERATVERASLGQQVRARVGRPHRGELHDPRRGWHGDPEDGLAQLGERELLGDAAVALVSAVVQRGLDRGGLLLPEQIRPPDPATAQEGDHPGCRRIRARRGFDAEEHGSRVRVGGEADTPVRSHTERPQPFQTGEGAGERGDIAVAEDAALGAQEGAGEGHTPQTRRDPIGLREQEIPGESQPMPRRDRPQECGQCC